ncbi:MAG: CotH kinase family protein, partial [Lachnospiraceae bacterium]|nr:CotH kinase family protein [Lachnospiraceae bacterium]
APVTEPAETTPAQTEQTPETKPLPTEQTTKKADEDPKYPYATMAKPFGNTNLGDCITFSVPEGVYDNEFDLQIFAPEGTTVYYTINGFTPDRSSAVYNGSVHVYNRTPEPNYYNALQRVNHDWATIDFTAKSNVAKIFVLRAVAVDKDGNASEVHNASYIVGMPNYKDAKVISIIVDPESLFDEKTGIYMTGEAYDNWYLNGQVGPRPATNYELKDEISERPAVMQYISSGTLVCSQPVGIRIQGAGARQYVPRRFSVFSRKVYSGSAYFTPTLFGEHKIHSIGLKDSNENSISMVLLENRDCAMTYSETTKCVLFINGEYWEHVYMSEKYSDNYFQNQYGIDKDDVVYVKVGLRNAAVNAEMVEKGFQAVLNFIYSHDFSVQANYDKLKTMIDVQSYIDFIAGNIIVCNEDYDEDKNFLVFRSDNTSGAGWNDGLWRWGYYDMDLLTWEMMSAFSATYGITSEWEVDPFTMTPLWVEHAVGQTAIFQRLIKSPEFRKQFAISYMDILNTNFSVQHVTQVLNQYGRDPETYRKGFYLQRPAYASMYLKQFFGLSEESTLTVAANDPSMGYVVVNTVAPDLSSGSWTGKYYTDFKVPVRAVARPGYEFAGWEGDVQGTSDTFDCPVYSGGTFVRAVFRKVQ